MPSLKIRFVSGKGWDSKLIEYYSRCEWSHVELLFDTITFGAQFKGGVDWRSVTDACYAKAAKYEVWEIPLTVVQDIALDKLINDAVGAKYDWPAIVSFVLGAYRFHLEGAYICSGFVTGVLEALGLLKIDLPIETIDPRDVRLLIPNVAGAIRRST